MLLRLLLNGYKGRMGQAILAAAPAAGAEVVARVEAGETLHPGLFKGVDAAVDFSTHEATLPLAKLAARAGVPLVIGTTGHTPDERKGLRAVAKKLPVVWAGNYSVGINVLNYLVKEAAEKLGLLYDIEIIEMHHRHKKDAPSGTAEKLLEVISRARLQTPSDVVHGRRGLTGPRPRGEIGVHALRGGDVVGDHTVIFAGDGERLELTHRASSRAIFAQGALRAAQWLHDPKREPGLYGMEDVLELK